ncbi:MAG: DUF2783 domain-containing protein [Pseudochelatococcus sp.]|jgi:hypothetical protein|uniref:DUF2783 domain-containing protein n=1 Tax=Pseudochelatococcus sp. TaxID=2020869 RepID=UPI003D93CC9F
MPALNLTSALKEHDEIYEQLVRMHEGLSEQESLKLWARFALILINHIGDRDVVDEAIRLARSHAAS